MRSLRTKFTFVTVCVVIIAVVAVTILTVFSIRNSEKREFDQLLQLLCETGEKNLDYYFNSVQKSVTKVAAFAEADLDGLSDEDLALHMEHVSAYFDETASKTNGVLTYYYRVDPEISKNVVGFWYVDVNGDGFVRHTVTDLTEYDTSDTSNLVWFTVPKYEGKAIWLQPYITDTINWRVISYNVPIYWRGTFVGVVGIEIDYSTMKEQVESIRPSSNGYAFLSDAEGNLFYHPTIDITQLTPDTMPVLPEGAKSDSTFFKYEFEGVKKVGAWFPLSNGMRLNVVAPVNETEGNWRALILNISVLAAAVLAAAIIFTMLYTRRITRPIKQLTEAADKVSNGSYDFTLDYEKDDEVGRLTKTFKRLAMNTRENISYLNNRVFVDALTRVKNQGAFMAAISDLQNDIDKGRREPEYAICIFDCDNLKTINDSNGHEKGDIYLKTASKAICNTFHHSPVFRVGGDEFAVLLLNESYKNMDALIDQFEQAVYNINSSYENAWEQVHISMGVASFDKENDRSVYDVLRRADRKMYEIKRQHKTDPDSAEG